jgi:hypothetical protein
MTAAKTTTPAPVVAQPEHDFTRPMFGDGDEARERRVAAEQFVERTLPTIAAIIGKLRAAAAGLANHHMRGRTHGEHARFARIESAATEFLNLIR